MSNQAAQLNEYRQRNKENDVTEDMYLADIKERHAENRKLLEKDLRKIILTGPKHAAFIMAGLVAAAAQRLGLPALFMKHKSIIEKKSFTHAEQQRLEGRMTLDLAKSGVTVENLDHSGIEPRWQGIYFYKNNEIVYFISALLQAQAEKSLIIKPYQLPKDERFILTNVPGV